MTVALGDVEAAAARIDGRVHRTPVVRSRLLDAEAGCQVHAKAEHLQRAGSFKVRGATSAVRALDPAVLARGVIAVSSGNHAQAVALAAAEAGTSAVIVMPADSNPAKLAATRAYGAEVVSEGVTHERRDEVVLALAAERGLHLIHPYDDPDVIAGQGTAALELVEQAGDLDVVVVPVGGGGLIAGTAVAVKGRSPGTRVVGVEPAGRRPPLPRRRPPRQAARPAGHVRRRRARPHPWRAHLRGHAPAGRRDRHRHRGGAAGGGGVPLVPHQAAGGAVRRAAGGGAADRGRQRQPRRRGAVRRQRGRGRARRPPDPGRGVRYGRLPQERMPGETRQTR
jgi:Pyridoxal-phosphate dependent enzyme